MFWKIYIEFWWSLRHFLRKFLDLATRGLICCGGSQWEFAGSAGGAGDRVMWPLTLTRLPAEQGSLASHVSIRCQCHKHQYTGGQKENFFAKCHLSSFFSRSLTFRPCEALPASSLGCLLQSKHFLSIMFKQTQNVSSSVYSSPPLLPSSSPTELWAGAGDMWGYLSE